MSKNGCTAAGYAAAEAELQALQNRGRFRRNAHTDGELSVESMATQSELVDREVCSVQRRISSLTQFRGTHTPQPPPTQFETVELGHPVIIAYRDSQDREVEKRYVMGGAGEPEIYSRSGFMMLKSTSPLGELLMSKRVGDIFDAFLSGRERPVRVKEILRPLVPDKQGDDSLTQVTRLSINGTVERAVKAA